MRRGEPQYAHHIETPRLALEPMTVEDAQELYDAVISQPDVMRWLASGRPGTLADARAACLDHVEHWQQHGIGDFAVRDRESREFLGRVGFRYRPEFGTDLGFAISPTAQGRGVASEAGAACLRYAFATANLDEVLAFALPDNTRSISLLTQLGATEAGTIVSSGNFCLRFRFLATGGTSAC